MGKTYVLLDVDQIKKYVFATGKLKEIRGASAILDELNRKTMYELVRGIDPGVKKIFANGGAGMFLVNDENKAASCIKAVEKLFHKKTLTGSISGAWASYSDGDDFKKVFDVLACRLRKAKDEKGFSVHPASHSFFRPCDSCGEEYGRHIEQDDEVVCASCHGKRKKDRQIKKRIRQLLSSGDNLVQSDETWEWLIQKLMDEPYYGAWGKDRPEEFNDIGELSSPPNYMGLLYADGNNMGKRLETLKSEEDIKDFSTIVVDAIRSAVLKAVLTHLKPEGRFFPFDILLLGGDDLVMATTAHKAIETAITIANAFKDCTGKRFKERGLGPPLELSMGVVIAHAKFPFGGLLELAESLLGFAKKEGAKRRQKGLLDNSDQGLINFRVVNAGASLDFAEDYKTNLSYKEESKIKKIKTRYCRTLRPYTPQDMEQILLKSVRDAKYLPRNKIQVLRDAIFLDDYHHSVFELLAIYNRLGEARKNLMDILLKFSKDCKPEPIGWFEKQGVRYTPFLDIAELYDFIQ